MVAKVTSFPDDVIFEVGADETLLSAALRANVSFAHACGGRAKCSTCRIWVSDGLEGCPDRNDLEASMADRLGFDEHVRLACQLRPMGNLSVRRLVLDETDLMMCSQLDREVASRSGEVASVTIFFSDIVNFTGLSERLLAYDVMYLLNRYFVQAGDIIERNGGYIDKFIGDAVMAIFGADGRPDASLRAVNSALQTLAAVDQMKPYFMKMYDADFDIRIGLHYGEAVVGTLGSVGHERMTVIGDVVNVASRIEAANKKTGTRFLISDVLFEQVNDMVSAAGEFCVQLQGVTEPMTLHEIGDLTTVGQAALELAESRDTMFFAGRTWTRIFHKGELKDGAHRVLPFADRDIVIIRDGDDYFAFNNACPHLNIPLFERRADIEEGSLGLIAGTDRQRSLYSEVTSDRGLVCRWHNSCFDLQTGEVREWAPRLENGMSPGWEFIGEISKNASTLKTFQCYVDEEYLWMALD